MAQIKNKIKSNKGESLVWFSSLGLTLGLLMIIGILSLIIVEGVSVFWPKNINLIELREQSKNKFNNQLFFAGEKIIDKERNVNNFVLKEVDGKKKLVAEVQTIKETQFYVANRDIYGFSFFYVDIVDIIKISKPENLMMIDRNNDSRAILMPKSLIIKGLKIAKSDKKFAESLEESLRKSQQLNKQVYNIANNELRKINSELKEIFVKAHVQVKKAAEHQEIKTVLSQYVKIETSLVNNFPNLNEAIKNRSSFMEKERKTIDKFMALRQQLLQSKLPAIEKLIKLQQQSYIQGARSVLFLKKIAEIKKKSQQDKLIAEDATGKTVTLNIGHIASYYYPNQLSVFGKLSVFFKNISTFIFDNPREANTQGGVFPAILGTFIMTILMSIAVTPLGVIAAIYLKEYARQGTLTRIIRIAINNLAGIPSIVFGAFGLGFFVYGLGYNLDKVFFSDHIDSGSGAVFGTGGMLWCSLTLALMTLPVVIVASEEALTSVLRGMREGAYGCGASKWQMISTVVIPASIPGIITGIILAMARGAGEVAPLMLVGVVKVAPNLPINNIYPFIHLDQKFMHLGFHIYDLGFQSPDSEAAKPMVFATTLLLILIVCALNLIGIVIRQHLKKKYSTGVF